MTITAESRMQAALEVARLAGDTALRYGRATACGDGVIATNAALANDVRALLCAPSGQDPDPERRDA